MKLRNYLKDVKWSTRTFLRWLRISQCAIDEKSHLANMLKLDNNKCVAGALDDLHIKDWTNAGDPLNHFLLENLDNELSGFGYLEAWQRSILEIIDWAVDYNI